MGSYEQFLEMTTPTPQVVVKPKPKRTPRKKATKSEPTISSLNWDIQQEYDKNIRTTHLDNREFESREFDIDIMKEDLRDYVFLCDNDGTRYRERIWDKIKEFGVVKWFEAKGFPTNESSLWYNRYTGSETTIADQVGGDNPRQDNTLEEQGYFLWENYCPKDIFDKCELTETSEIKEMKKQRDELRSPQEPCLIKCKELLEKLCEDKGEKIDKIWFDTSVPMDNSVSIRLADHRCWNACVEFRFKGGKLEAYDSHFGGGTSFIHNDQKVNEEETIRTIMERVFNKECSQSGWEDSDEDRGHREIKIDDKGWLIK